MYSNSIQPILLPKHHGMDGNIVYEDLDSSTSQGLNSVPLVSLQNYLEIIDSSSMGNNHALGPSFSKSPLQQSMYEKAQPDLRIEPKHMDAKMKTLASLHQPNKNTLDEQNFYHETEKRSTTGATDLFHALKDYNNTFQNCWQNQTNPTDLAPTPQASFPNHLIERQYQDHHMRNHFAHHNAYQPMSYQQHIRDRNNFINLGGSGDKINIPSKRRRYDNDIFFDERSLPGPCMRQPQTAKGVHYSYVYPDRPQYEYQQPSSSKSMAPFTQSASDLFDMVSEKSSKRSTKDFEGLTAKLDKQAMRRQTHKMNESRRRQNIRDCINSFQEMLPESFYWNLSNDCQNQESNEDQSVTLSAKNSDVSASAVKLHMVITLQLSVKYMRSLIEELDTTKKDLAQEKMVASNMKKLLQKYGIAESEIESAQENDAIELERESQSGTEQPIVAENDSVQ